MKKIVSIAAVLFFIHTSAFSQAIDNNSQLLGREADSVRTITTAVPFLIISPDARSGALGEAGVAISPDANAVHWNPAKLPFAEDDMSLGINVTPWLRRLGINDMYLNYLTGYYKVSKERVIYGSLTYFNLGDIQFTDEQGVDLQLYQPREFALSSGYSMKFSKAFGAGITLKYIYSNLSGQFQFSDGTQGKPGSTAAADLSSFYTKDISLSGRPSSISAGVCISNIGAKIAYTNTGAQRDFIPTNFRLGAALKTELDAYNSVTFIVDMNKLLVPSPPLYAFDAEKNVYITDSSGNKIVAKGMNPNRSVASGIFNSFSDAPDGFNEEFTEIVWNVGIEYWYNKILAARGGYFYEHRLKGARQFFTAGLGIKYQKLGIDVAYIIPLRPNHPLAETLRVGISFTMAHDEKKTESITE